MKRIQSILCASALAIALSSTVLAGNIHGVTASAPGNIHGSPSQISSFLTYITGVVVTSIAGNIHG